MPHATYHTVIKLTPVAYGCREEHVALAVAAVDTHRPRPPVIPAPLIKSPVPALLNGETNGDTSDKSDTEKPTH
ncbi:hypothetical protein MSG28_010497 [Choristoneura fumiferana]|nr:hypothetical protein MSG28_010497 [Choristoneura fumiferana]